MALTDWIPIGSNTPRCVEVVRIAGKSKKSRREAFATLVDFWIWVTEQTSDGVLAGYTLELLPTVIEDTSVKFWQAVADEGWIEVHIDCLVVPDNLDHPFVTKGSKARLLKARRQANWKSGAPPGAPQQTSLPARPTATTTLKSAQPAKNQRSMAEKPATVAAGFLVSDPGEVWHQAERLAKRIGVSVEHFDFGHRVAALLVGGKLSDRDVAECAAETKKGANGNPIGLFRTKLRDVCKRKNIPVDSLAKSVRFPADYDRGPPEPVPEIAELAKALSGTESP